MVAKNSVSYRKLLIFYAITEIKNLWLDVSIWQFQSAHSKCWITKAYNIKNILRILCDRNTNFALNISSYLNFKMAIFYDEKQIELPIIYFNRLKTWDFLGCGYSDCLGCDIVNSANCAHQITRVINQRLQFVCQSKLCTKIMYQNYVPKYVNRWTFYDIINQIMKLQRILFEQVNRRRYTLRPLLLALVRLNKFFLSRYCVHEN